MFNPYILSEQELNERIRKLRSWLHNYNGHERYSEAIISLDMAVHAKKTFKKRQQDQFLDMVCNTLFVI